jgi:hypothetical protein
MIRLNRHAALVISAMMCGLVGAGCPKKSAQEPTASQPTRQVAPRPAAPEIPAPKAVQTPASRPVAAATRPAQTRPVEIPPASSYDPNPPYTVKLLVRSPREKQPGWLKILTMADDKQAATTTGTFPEQNEIQIVTDNVQRLQVHIGFLPLAPRKRTFLRIDAQNIEITTRNREYLIMERSPAGIWSVVPQRK